MGYSLKGHARTRKIIEAIGQIPLGDIPGVYIPYGWFKAIRLDEDRDEPKVYLPAVLVLAHIAYYYRPTYIKTAEGNLAEMQKKFEGARLRIVVRDLCKEYGLSYKQARSALDYLHEHGYIVKKVVEREVRPNGAVWGNVLYVEPVPERIAEITRLGIEQQAHPGDTQALPFALEGGPFALEGGGSALEGGPFALEGGQTLKLRPKTSPKTTSQNVLRSGAEAPGANAPAVPGNDDDAGPGNGWERIYEQPELTAAEAEIVLDAWQAGAKINPNTVAGKVFRRRFGYEPDYRQLASVYRTWARKGAGEQNRDAWYSLVAAIHSMPAADNPYAYLHKVGKNLRLQAGQPTRREEKQEAQKKARSNGARPWQWPWPQEWGDDFQAVARRLDAIQRHNAGAPLPEYWEASLEIVREKLGR